LLSLLKDKSPGVRMHAARAAAKSWDSRFVVPMQGLFADENPDVRNAAAACLSMYEGRGQTSRYLKLASSADTNVRICALWVLLKVNPDAIPGEPLTRLLRASDPEMVNIALHILWKLNRDVVSRADLLPALRSTWMENVMIALRLIEGNGRVQPALPEPDANARLAEQRKRWLTSLEAAVLATNQLAHARLRSLKILERNADKDAVDMAVQMLRDPNRVVRGRAFRAMRFLSGKSVSDTDPAPWEQWWGTNRAAYVPKGASPVREAGTNRKPFPSGPK
jgi:HEAT repeat protein